MSSYDVGTVIGAVIVILIVVAAVVDQARTRRPGPKA